LALDAIVKLHNDSLEAGLPLSRVASPLTNNRHGEYGDRALHGFRFAERSWSVLFRQPVGPSRHARKCLGMVRGQLAPYLPWDTRWCSAWRGGMRPCASCAAGLELPPKRASLCPPKLVPSRRHFLHQLPCREMTRSETAGSKSVESRPLLNALGVALIGLPAHLAMRAASRPRAAERLLLAQIGERQRGIGQGARHRGVGLQAESDRVQPFL